MPRQSEIDRILVLLYRSNSAHDCINFTRPAGWLDKLPMVGLDELEDMFQHMAADVAAEKVLRIQDDMPRYSRAWHTQRRGEIAAGAGLLAEIGVKPGPADDPE